MKKITSSIILLFTSLCFNAQTVEEQVKSLLDSIYKDIPEAVGLITHVEAPNYQISYSYAVGLMDTLEKKTLHKDQPGGIASNTKTYTSATILRLIEEEQLKLDQAIEERKDKMPVEVKCYSDYFYFIKEYCEEGLKQIDDLFEKKLRRE